jgi:DNA-binding transcriptional regulator YhcF (GntR family)
VKKAPALISARAVARHLGLDGSTVLRLYRQGVIEAEVYEGRIIRFDLQKVRTTLAKRAMQNREAKESSDLVPLI